MDYEQEIVSSLKPMRIIWFALFFSLILYMIIALFASKTINIKFDIMLLKNIKIALYSVSFVTIISTIFVNKFLLKVDRNVDSEKAVDIQRSVRKFNVAMIISLALSESIGIYGIILFFITKNAADLYLLISMSALSMILYFPKRSSLSSIIQESM